MFNVNSVNTDLTPRSAASELGRVYIVCKCFFYMTLGINGLRTRVSHLLEINILGHLEKATSME